MPYKKPATLALEPFCGIRPINNILKDNNNFLQRGSEWPSAPISSIKELFKLSIKGEVTLDADPGFYIYKITKLNGKSFLGLVGLLPSELLDHEFIYKHEEIIAERVESVRVGLSATGMQVNPLLMLHEKNDELSGALESYTADNPPASHFSTNDESHELWIVSDSESSNKLYGLLSKISKLYIADGHHRAAAIQSMRQAGAVDAEQKLMTMLLSLDQVNILDYSRIVVSQIAKEHLFTLLNKFFHVLESDVPYKPKNRGSFGMCFKGRWYELHVLEKEALKNTIDTAYLDEKVIETIKVIDPHCHLKYLSVTESEKDFFNCMSSEVNSIAFTVAPISQQQLVELSQQEKVMPAKSTWIEPKVPRGVISYFS